jgi:DNA-binding response OmpR family regulator
MTMEQAIAQGWHGEAWEKLPEHEQQQSLRRAAAALTSLAAFNSGGLLEVSGYTFDPHRKAVWTTADSQPVTLTKKEFDLAYYLASRAGVCCATKDVLRSVWGLGHLDDPQYLRVCLSSLRPKLSGVEIITRAGVGVEWELKPV